jgi:hypothetical protein
MANTLALQEVMPALLQTNQAVMGPAIAPSTASTKQLFRKTLAVSQYRHNIDEYIDDPLTVFTYQQ